MKFSKSTSNWTHFQVTNWPWKCVQCGNEYWCTHFLLEFRAIFYAMNTYALKLDPLVSVFSFRNMLLPLFSHFSSHFQVINNHLSSGIQNVISLNALDIWTYLETFNYGLDWLGGWFNYFSLPRLVWLAGCRTLIWAWGQAPIMSYHMSWRNLNLKHKIHLLYTQVNRSTLQKWKWMGCIYSMLD